MSSFHDQIFSEIDAARKLAADYVTRYGRAPVPVTKFPRTADRLAQAAAAEVELAALAVEEELLTHQVRERAEQRAKARAVEEAVTGPDRNVHGIPEHTNARWNAIEILNGLTKLRARERSAAEELIRKARAATGDEPSAVAEQLPDESVFALEKHATSFRAMWSPSLGSAQIWYFTSEGTRCGPVTFQELRTMAASRVLDPRLDMVWKEGMEGWKPAGLLDGLFERRPFPAEMPEKAATKRLSSFAALPKDLTAALASKQMVWPGVGRRSLWLGLLLVPLLWSQLMVWGGPTIATASGSGLTFKVLSFGKIVPAAILLHLILMRLVNLGMSRWWAVVLAIPVLNLWVGFRGLICPPGFAHHRKLDRSGIVIGLAVLMIIPAVCYLDLKHPGNLSLEQLRSALPRSIESAGKMILSW